MGWLFEDPTTMIVATVALLGVLAVILYQTGRVAIVAVMIGLLALLAVGIVIERAVVTPGEEVSDTLYEVAAALDANDLTEVEQFFELENDRQALEVRRRLGSITIEEASIRRVNVVVNERANPPTATADLVGSLRLKYQSQDLPYDSFVRKFRVFLRKTPAGWKIYNYEESSPLEDRE